MSEPAPGPTPVRRPRRLSPLTPVVRAPILAVAVVGGSWQTLIEQRTLGSIGVVGLTVLAVLVAGAVYGVASWLRTTYWIDDDELRIDTGVLVRRSRRIRIDRLQGIDIVQPLVARLFGLAELRLDVASGQQREGRLAFLRHAEAVAVRSLLLERRRALSPSQPAQPAQPAHSAEPFERADPAGPDGPGTVHANPAPAPPTERVLVRLHPGRLLVSLVLSTETAVAGVASVVSAALSVTSGVPVVGILVPALVAAGLSLARKLTGFYGFTLADTSAGLHVSRGLTSLSSHTIAPARIQGLVIREPLLWRALGWARLEVSVAGRDVLESDVADEATVVPVATLAEVIAVATQVLGGRDASAVPLGPAPRRAAWRAPLTWWNLGVGIDDHLVVSRRGWWVRRTDAVPHARVQSVRLAQGPVQRRLALAAVHLDSPPGPVHVAFAHGETAAVRRLAEEATRRAREARHHGNETAQPRPETIQANPPNDPGSTSSASEDARPSASR